MTRKLVGVKVIKAPEIPGVPQEMLDQMVGITLAIKELPSVAYFGSRKIPPGVTERESRVGVSSFLQVGNFFVVNTSSLILGAQALGGREELWRWLEQLFLSGVEQVALDPDYVDVLF